MPTTPIPARRRFRAIPAAISVATAASLLTLGGCSTFGSVRHTETRAMQVPHIAGSALSIENANGAIEALSTDRADVSIEFVLRSDDLERLRFANVHADRMGDDTLRVWVEWPGGTRRANEGASISVNIPDARNITARTSNGSIVIAGLGGKADLQTTNGPIRVDTHDGPIYARTDNGAIQAEHLNAGAELYSSNGSIIVTDAFGPIRAETSNANASVSTMAGNPGPVRVLTSNGRIDLDLGEGFEGILKCDTTNGRVEVSDLDEARLVESSSRNVVLRVGDSDVISAARTSNGSIRVHGR